MRFFCRRLSRSTPEIAKTQPVLMSLRATILVKPQGLRVSRFSPANSRVPKLSTSQLGDDVVQICSHNIVKANQKWRPYLRGLLAKHFPANSKYVCSCFPCHRECSTQGPGRMAIGTTPRPGVSRMSAVHKPGQCQCCLPVFVVVCR